MSYHIFYFDYSIFHHLEGRFNTIYLSADELKRNFLVSCSFNIHRPAVEFGNANNNKLTSGFQNICCLVKSILLTAAFEHNIQPQWELTCISCLTTLSFSGLEVNVCTFF